MFPTLESFPQRARDLNDAELPTVIVKVIFVAAASVGLFTVSY